MLFDFLKRSRNGFSGFSYFFSIALICCQSFETEAQAGGDVTINVCGGVLGGSQVLLYSTQIFVLPRFDRKWLADIILLCYYY